MTSVCNCKLDRRWWAKDRLIQAAHSIFPLINKECQSIGSTQLRPKSRLAALVKVLLIAHASWQEGWLAKNWRFLACYEFTQNTVGECQQKMNNNKNFKALPSGKFDNLDVVGIIFTANPKNMSFRTKPVRPSILLNRRSIQNKIKKRQVWKT